jgi:ABC-2 type transport system ATP-binding protein
LTPPSHGASIGRLPMITVQNLSKKYKEVTAVDNISFEVEKSKIFAFLGPNGAGKSTTIKMLTTLTEPTSGTITINGFDLKHHKDDVRKSFGIVFQDPSLDDDLTAFENMQFHAALYGVSGSARNSKIEQLLTFVELWDRKGHLVKTFSGGMKRRLEMARGLLHNPKILFLDEPTLGLDPQTRNHIWKYIRDINKSEGMTVFFTTHYMEEAEQVADEVAVIDHGKIVAKGTTSQLKETTNTSSLEEAFLNLTGHNIRDEESNGLDQMRNHFKMHHR